MTSTIVRSKWPLILSAYAVSINGACAYAFYDDKQRALNNEWRIPEKSLCLLGVMGGWIGGYWAMNQFRHKTKKASFRQQFFTSTMMNIGAVGMIGHRMKGGQSLLLQQLLQKGGLKQHHTLNQRQQDLYSKTWKQRPSKKDQQQQQQQQQPASSSASSST